MWNIRVCGFSVLGLLVVYGLINGRAECASHQREQRAVRTAALDYIEGIYTADADRIRRSVHPELAKLGFAKKQDGYQLFRMTFGEFVEKVKLEDRIPKNAVKKVVLLDVSDQTASVKLVAWWGVDYLHLAKFDGHWKVVNVLWQSYPDGKTRTVRQK